MTNVWSMQEMKWTFSKCVFKHFSTMIITGVESIIHELISAPLNQSLNQRDVFIMLDMSRLNKLGFFIVTVTLFIAFDLRSNNRSHLRRSTRSLNRRQTMSLLE